MGLYRSGNFRTDSKAPPQSLVLASTLALTGLLAAQGVEFKESKRDGTKNTVTNRQDKN